MPMGSWIVGGSVLILFLLLLYTVATMYRKVPPNRALIIFGLGGPLVVQGGGKIVWPLIQSATEISLELMSFDVTPDNEMFTSQGVAVQVEAVAQLKIKSDRESILTAAEQFLSRGEQERHAALRLVMEGHLRGIMGQLTVEQIVKEPDMVAERMRANVAADMEKMGLEIISFTIKQVKDKNEYIVNMGRPDIARIKMMADIAGAEASRDTDIKRAEAMRESAKAKALAEQEQVIAQTASQAKQAEAVRDLELKKAEYEAQTKRAQAQADKSYDIQANVMQQQVITEQVRVQQVEREAMVKVQEAEIVRREKELIATVLKQAEVDKLRVETQAAAERQKLAIEAAGRAEALKQQGTAEAEVIRLRGTAEAEILKTRGLAEAETIKARGQAEAEAMQVKADAFQSYNQAAILDKFLSGLPELARAMAEPLSKVDRITLVSTGGEGAGASKLMADLAKVIATAPELVETLTGMKLSDLLKAVPGLAAAVPQIEHRKEAAATGEGGGNHP